jgi:hypothetical protein
MSRKEYEKLSSDEQHNFYRCPACGAMVDNRHLDEVVEHHAHVLHPGRFELAPSISAEFGH